MKEYIPQIGEPFCGPECPLHNTEWDICNITSNKCLKWKYDDEIDEDNFDFPDDCPAKEGVKIFFPEKKK
jgi:hypothetical protein